MENTKSDCYLAALDVKRTLKELVDKQDFALAQVLNIKVPATLTAFNLEIMI